VDVPTTTIGPPVPEGSVEEEEAVDVGVDAVEAPDAASVGGAVAVPVWAVPVPDDAGVLELGTDDRPITTTGPPVAVAVGEAVIPVSVPVTVAEVAEAESVETVDEAETVTDAESVLEGAAEVLVTVAGGAESVMEVTAVVVAGGNEESVTETEVSVLVAEEETEVVIAVALVEVCVLSTMVVAVPAGGGGA
jgi:hypothetical protein